MKLNKKYWQNKVNEKTLKIINISIFNKIIDPLFLNENLDFLFEIIFKTIDELERRNNIYREAIEKYADKNNWLEDGYGYMQIWECHKEKHCYDHGFEIAQDALKKVERVDIKYE